MAYTFDKISDVKLRARKIAREQNIARHRALDFAAQGGGFQNFAHAVKLLPALTPVRHQIEVSQSWWDSKLRAGGRASISIALRNPLGDLIKPHHLVEALAGCRLDGEKRLISDGSMRNRSESVIDVAKVARALQFMDATGLKPSRSARCYPKGDQDNRPPIADHDTCWFDPEARTHILITQPYSTRAALRSEKQVAWEARHGWVSLFADWGSMYGFTTELYLMCPQAYASTLREKVRDLERSPAAISNDDVRDADRTGANVPTASPL